MKNLFAAGLVGVYWVVLNLLSGLFFHHWIERNHVGLFVVLMVSANILGTAMFYGICKLYTDVLNVEPIKSIVEFLDDLGVIFFLLIVAIVSYFYLLFLGMVLTLVLTIALVWAGLAKLNRSLKREQDGRAVLSRLDNPQTHSGTTHCGCQPEKAEGERRRCGGEVSKGASRGGGFR